jgi:hypothetical protein
MKVAVPQDLEPEIGHARHKAQQVMPLKYLVQQDSVEEATQSEPDDAAP